MKETFPKWILEDGCLIFGNVEQHIELCNNKDNVKGGGWYSIDVEHKILHLYNTSSLFLFAEHHEVMSAVRHKDFVDDASFSIGMDITGYRVTFSKEMSLTIHKYRGVVIN